MAEPINLDELLNKSESVEETTSESTDQVNSEDTAIENEGSGDFVENSGSQNDETKIDENTTSGSDESSISNEDDFSDAEDQSNDLPKDSPETTEYKFKDDFIKKAVDYYEKYGNLTPFLEATSVNYDAVSDTDLLKLKFDKENSDLSPKARQRLFEKELEKYNLDSYDEDDAEVGQALLKRDAAKLRASLKEEQAQFVQSIQPSVQEQQVSKEELDAQRNESRKIIETGVSNVIKNNFIKLEANGEGINYQIADKNKVVDYALDSNQFLSTFAKDGQVDWDKWTKVVAFAENPTAFIDELIKHGKSLGRKSMEADLKNVKPIVGSSKEVVESTDFQNPFDNPVQFLKEMTISKK